MPKLNPVTAKKLIKILNKLGFNLLRIRGSHHFFLNSKTGKTATIPLHNNQVLSIGILKKILKDVELNIESYEKLRKKI